LGLPLFLLKIAWLALSFTSLLALNTLKKKRAPRKMTWKGPKIQRGSGTYRAPGAYGVQTLVPWQVGGLIQVQAP